MLIACTTASKAQDSTTMIRLTPKGFERVLLERNSLIQCKELLELKQREIQLLTLRNKLQDEQLTGYKNLDSQNQSLITDLKGKLKHEKGVSLKAKGVAIVAILIAIFK